MGAEEEGAVVWGGGVRREVMVSGMITAGAEKGHNTEQRLHMSKIRMQTWGPTQKKPTAALHAAAHQTWHGGACKMYTRRANYPV